MYKRNPPRPVVSLPMATRFNQAVALDIKFVEKRMLLHMIDMCTRYSVCSIIRNKEAKTIAEAIFMDWVQLFGVPEGMLTDNGGEFGNELFREVCEAINARPLSTPAESPWANGIVERHNATLGEMIAKVRQDVKCSLEVAVAWSISAKNGLANVHGFTPSQLVFGYNPRLPTVQSNMPPALTGTQYSKIIEENLHAMHRARTAYIKSEPVENFPYYGNTSLLTS